MHQSTLARSYSTIAIPFLILIFVTGPLLLLSNGQASLMAHDEGYYAQQARWIWETGDWVTVQWWRGEPLFDRTIGFQWLIALCYHGFGVNEWTARFPSLLANLVSGWLTYAIAQQLTNQRIATLSLLILSVTPIWVQYGRLATQDATLVCLELLGIYALLRAEQSPRPIAWGLLAGAMVGSAFLVKGFMVIVPILALLPYLIGGYHRHLHNLGLWLGLLLGTIPPGWWLWASFVKYGWLPLRQLFGKLFLLGTSDQYFSTPWFYLWNIPVNAFPWVLLSLIGIPVALRTVQSRHDSLLLGYPASMWVWLTLFKTRTPYYALQLLPFVAILAALALDRLCKRFPTSRLSPILWLLPTLSYGFGGLALLVTIAGVLALTGFLSRWVGSPVGQYGPIALLLGIVWLGLPVIWWNRHRLAAAPTLWLVSWLSGAWFALAGVGLTGLFGDFNPDVKASLKRGAIAPILATHPIQFIVQPSLSGAEHETWVLLSFYTPKLGQRLTNVDELPPGKYAWVSPAIAPTLPSHYQTKLTIRDWQLVHHP